MMQIRSGTPICGAAIPIPRAGIAFANIAVDLIGEGISGRMLAIQGGNFVHTTLPDPAIGPRRVDVARTYNVERFRPQYAGRLGASIFLAPADG